MWYFHQNVLYFLHSTKHEAEVQILLLSYSKIIFNCHLIPIKILYYPAFQSLI